MKTEGQLLFKEVMSYLDSVGYGSTKGGEVSLTAAEVGLILQSCGPSTHKLWVNAIRKAHRSGHIKTKPAFKVPPTMAIGIICHAAHGSCFMVYGNFKVYIVEEGE